ncbi:MAG TPA: hypothetical protein VFS41_06960, partial [Edaphobacter sp.]|nr:hypothetical protein [Edaphobacter sp.]
FRDWERSFSETLGVNGFGLDLTAPYWSYKKPRTWEEGNMQSLQYCRFIREKGVIHEKAPILLVHDSIAAAVPQSMAAKNLDELNMNDNTALARVTSSTLKTMAAFAEDFNATFLYLNQIRTKPGVVYGDPTTTPGGGSMEFYSTTRIALGKEKITQKGPGGTEFIGVNVKIKCVKSKLTKPFQEVTLRLTFDEHGVAHFDKELSLIELLLDQKKLVSPRAGYVEWDGKQLSKRALADLVKKDALTPALVGLLST